LNIFSILLLFLFVFCHYFHYSAVLPVLACNVIFVIKILDNKQIPEPTVGYMMHSAASTNL